VFAFKVCKKVIICEKKLFSKMQYGHKKTQNLMLISNPVKKAAKKLCEKSYQQKVTEKLSF
jgi:hypothetical protein